MTDRDPLDELVEFQQRRRTVIGATDSPKILLLSRWGSPLSVYQDKVSEDPPRPPSLAAWLGLKLQSTVGELYTTATGTRLRAVNVQFKHPDHPYIGCHLDFRAWGDSRLIVEAKTRSSMKGWGPDGSSEVPVEEWVQCQHEMAVANGRTAHVAVLFGHRDFRVYVVERDEEFIAKLIPKLVAFWHDHVLMRIPPPAAAPDHDLVHDLYPKGNGIIRPLTAEQAQVVRELVGARAAAKVAADAETALVNRVKQLIGEDDGISGPFGEITWRANKDSTVTDWMAAYADLAHLAMRDGWTDEDQLDRRLTPFTKVKPGARTIRYAFAGEEE